MGWTPFCRVSELESAGRVTRWLGAREACAVWEEGRPVVFDSVCPHAGGPLGEGKILLEKKERVLRCSWHGYRFQLRGGRCVSRPSLRMRIYPHRQEDGMLMVDLPETAVG